jgi:acyl-CoA thioesterase-1
MLVAMAAPRFFSALTEGGTDPAAVAAYLQSDGLHPNREDAAKIVAALGPQVLELLARVPKG